MNYFTTTTTTTNNNIIMKKAGQKRAYIVRKTTTPMELTELEDKARLFYRLAVVKDRKYRFRTYRSTFVGKEMVDSMVFSGLAESRKQAVALGRVLAKKFNLFQNCENNILNKTITFEDEPNKFYRFSSGALVVIRKINEVSVFKKDQKSVSSASTAATSTISDEDDDHSTRGPALRRQNGTRKIKPDNNEDDDDNNEMDVSVFKKKINVSSKKKVTAPISLPPKQAIVEQENDDESSRGSSKISATSTEVERLQEIQKLARKQTKFEIEAFERELSKEEKTKLEKVRIERLRFLAKEQLDFYGKKQRKSAVAAAHSIMEAINVEQEDDDVTVVDTKERMMADIIGRLQRNHSNDLVVTYGSLMNEVDNKVSTIYTGDHHIVETQYGDILKETEKKDDHVDGLLMDKFDTEEKAVAVSSKEIVSTSNKGKKWKQRMEAKKAVKNNKPAKQEVSKEVEPVKEEEPNEKETAATPVFITSPQNLRAGLRRGKSDVTESFDTFESMLNKKEENLLSMEYDDNQSAWTEFIIGDEEGREQYRLNGIKRRRPSYTSYVEETIIDDGEKSYMEFTVVDDETLYDEETVYDDEETVVSKWQPSVAPVSVAKKASDEQSYMDFTVFDDSTFAVSYVEDDVDYASPEPEPEEDEKILFHIFANHNSMADYDDDEITMDPVFRSQRTMDHHHVSMYPSAITAASEAEISCSSTSKKHLREILWKDLYSYDMPVVWSAMEELRTIVAGEPESRKHIVRMGGVMAIMGTMEEYFEEEVVQYLCCVILELLASMEPDARKVVNEMEGIQLIVRSMQAQGDSDRVQEAARAALVTVCRH